MGNVKWIGLYKLFFSVENWNRVGNCNWSEISIYLNRTESNWLHAREQNSAAPRHSAGMADACDFGRAKSHASNAT